MGEVRTALLSARNSFSSFDAAGKVGQAIAFCGLLGWAFGPRNFMKNWHPGRGGSGEVGLAVKKLRSLACLTR
ncbi:MAG: hypothetical protein WBQ65_10385, partial [Bryobacteraceae bacterium]